MFDLHFQQISIKSTQQQEDDLEFDNRTVVSFSHSYRFFNIGPSPTTNTSARIQVSNLWTVLQISRWCHNVTAFMTLAHCRSSSPPRASWAAIWRSTSGWTGVPRTRRRAGSGCRRLSHLQLKTLIAMLRGCPTQMRPTGGMLTAPILSSLRGATKQLRRAGSRRTRTNKHIAATDKLKSLITRPRKATYMSASCLLAWRSETTLERSWPSNSSLTPGASARTRPRDIEWRPWRTGRRMVTILGWPGGRPTSSRSTYRWPNRIWDWSPCYSGQRWPCSLSQLSSSFSGSPRGSTRWGSSRTSWRRRRTRRKQGQIK